MAAVARHAGLSSTGLISYHFKNKAALMAQVVSEIISEMADNTSRAIGSAADPLAMLHAYIRGNVHYIGTHRHKMKALMEIFLSGQMRDVVDSNESVVTPLERILEAGQRAGQFREFDVRVTASVIQRSIETVPMTLEAHPDLDVKACAEELVTLFDRGLTLS